MDRYRCLTILSGVAASLFASSHAHSDEIAGGFVLEPFQSGYPGAAIPYTGEAARRLVTEILPVAAEQTTRVVVHESIGIPGPGYTGLLFEIVMTPRAVFGGVCEEPHAFVQMRYDPRGPYPSTEMKLAVRNGRIENHALEDIRWRGRYRSIPDQSASRETALETCRRLAADTSTWNDASDQYEFRRQERMFAMLLEALNSPRSLVECIGHDRKPCGLTRAQLVTVLTRTPPSGGQTLGVPSEDEVTVFQYVDHVTEGVMGNDYSVTARRKQDGKTTVRFEFTRDPRPAI